MHSIDIDFDVFKVLTSKRATESVSYNDVLRSLLGLESTVGTTDPTDPEPAAVRKEHKQSSGDWITKGVRFPAGTEFRATHKGLLCTGRVQGGMLHVDGKPYETPSAAAVAVTGTSINGWIFWECRTPGASSWQLIKSMRKGS